MENKIIELINDSIDVKKELINNNVDDIIKAINLIASSLREGNKILIFGNGGSAADAQHFAAEFIVRYKKERRSLACIALTTDTSILTASANDYDFKSIFSRQVEGLAKKGDVLIGVTTSGNSLNVINGIQVGIDNKCITICLTGACNGEIDDLKLDCHIKVPSNNVARIQESHELILHAICEVIDDMSWVK